MELHIEGMPCYRSSPPDGGSSLFRNPQFLTLASCSLFSNTGGNSFLPTPPFRNAFCEEL